MTNPSIERQIAEGGRVILRDARCRFEFARRGPGVLDIVIEGMDEGQFGTAALDEIAIALRRERPLELFVDASRASMPAVPVTREWARFFTLNRADLTRVSVLVSSKSVELSIAIAGHLSQTGRLIQVYTDPELFEARRKAAGGVRNPSPSSA